MFVCFWQSRTLLSRRLNSFSISCLILNLFDWRRLLTIYSLSTKNPIETNIWHQLHFVLKTFIVLKIISIYVYMYKYIIWHWYITWLFHSSEEVGYFALVFSTWQWNSLPPGLCQTVLWRKHAFCSLSHISIHDQKCCNNTSENQENTTVDTVGHHSILCVLHPAGLKHTIKI